MVGDPGIEPGVSRLEGVTVPCHTLRPVAHRGRMSPAWGGISTRAGGVKSQCSLALAPLPAQ